MHGEFDEEPELERSRRDTELTLNFTTLVGIFFAMVLLCGLFFGLGFAAGRYGPNDSAAAGQQVKAGGQPSAVEAGSRPKPSAAPQNPSEPQRAATVVSLPQSAGSNANPESAYPNASQPAVRPALPSGANPPQSAPSGGPAVSPAVASMVQIAAVSHQEDADVLVSALRKRGYGVTVRRQPADNLLHVQIGPFPNRNDAEVMRQKLLNDGYNAIVQP
jgi:cell division septation protein DedD